MTPLLCFFKPPDSEKLLPLFLHLNCLSRVWSLHVSSIHQILRSSCQTMCTHSFSTVGGLLIKSFDEEKQLSHLVHLYAFLFMISLKGWEVSWLLWWNLICSFPPCYWQPYEKPYVERLRKVDHCWVLRSTYGKPAPARIWTRKREIRPRYVPGIGLRIPKSYNTWGFVQNCRRRCKWTVLDSLL